MYGPGTKKRYISAVIYQNREIGKLGKIVFIYLFLFTAQGKNLGIVLKITSISQTMRKAARSMWQFKMDAWKL